MPWGALYIFLLFISICFIACKIDPAPGDKWQRPRGPKA